MLTGGIDTTGSTDRLVFGIFATLSEFERDLIKERTLAELAAAVSVRSGTRPHLLKRRRVDPAGFGRWSYSKAAVHQPA
ncbi:recombinase family protein [Rhodopila sp.]|uniref:recombinase family protein n=1 Tax=Rhodopila sp. TaxID=2480087 RepID=UPI003D123D24